MKDESTLKSTKINRLKIYKLQYNKTIQIHKQIIIIIYLYCLNLIRLIQRH